jgi:hypothetical protein
MQRLFRCGFGEEVQACVNCVGRIEVVDGGWKVLETHDLGKLPMYVWYQKFRSWKICASELVGSVKKDWTTVGGYN